MPRDWSGEAKRATDAYLNELARVGPTSPLPDQDIIDRLLPWAANEATEQCVLPVQLVRDAIEAIERLRRGDAA